MALKSYRQSYWLRLVFISYQSYPFHGAPESKQISFVEMRLDIEPFCPQIVHKNLIISSLLQLDGCAKVISGAKAKAAGTVKRCAWSEAELLNLDVSRQRKRAEWKLVNCTFHLMMFFCNSMGL